MPEGEFGLLFTDGSKFGRAEQLHLALLGLWAFEKKEKRLPAAGNLEEAEAIVKLAEEVRKLGLGLIPSTCTYIHGSDRSLTVRHVMVWLSFAWLVAVGGVARERHVA